MNKPNNSKIYKAAIYLRLSKEDDSLGDGSFKSESNSITNQRMLIRNFLDSVGDFPQLWNLLMMDIQAVILIARIFKK